MCYNIFKGLVSVVKKILYIFILCILVCMISIQVKATDIYDITSWKHLTTADIDEAIRVCNDEGDPKYVNYIYFNILGDANITSVQFDSYDSAQHYVEVANHFLNALKKDTNIVAASGFHIEDETWLRIENNIDIASKVEKQSSGNTGGSTTGGGGNSKNKKKAWNEYTLDDYRGNGEKGLAEMWEIIKNVPIANLTTQEKDYYVQCLNAIDENKQKVDSNFSAEVSDEIPKLYDQISETYGEELEGTDAEKIINGDKPIYNNPLINYNPNETAENVTPDSIIADADIFMADGQSSDVATINQNNANIAFNSIYNILLAIGITVTVIWGLIIAIKLMMSSVEEKAEYKKMLWPYLVGCIVIFGSFAIWKIVIVAMNNVL